MIRIEARGQAWKFDARKVKPNRTLMRQVGEAVEEEYKYRLDRGKGVDNAGNEIPLEPLSSLTVDRKGSSLPLVDTAGMQSSFRVDGSRLTSSRVVLAFTPEQALKAAVHQFGAVIVPKQAKALRIPTGKGTEDAIFRKRAEIPARPHVGISRRDRREIRSIFAAWMRKSFRS